MPTLHVVMPVYDEGPTLVEIVRRVLDPRSVALWFPGNAEALAVNQQLASLKRSQAEGEHLVDREQQRLAAKAGPQRAEEKAASTFAGDDFTRYTEMEMMVGCIHMNVGV